MNKRMRKEIADLTMLLEAEFEGKPFSREAVKDLANKLGDNHPGIAKTMQLISARVAEGETREGHRLAS